jgi:hypothetical protein
MDEKQNESTFLPRFGDHFYLFEKLKIKDPLQWLFPLPPKTTESER